jgi:hypothetical protein
VAASPIDPQIDELYQLPPEQFTAARNDLVKRVPPDQKAAVRALRKPSAPAWAVNQLYWRSRRSWDALIRAAESLREAHRSALEGRSVDLRKADAAHREALAQALKDAMAHVSASGHPLTAALKDAVVRTLQALPADIEPGRLDAPLESAGFGLLGGMGPARAIPAKAPPKPATARPVETRPPPRAEHLTGKERKEEERRAKAEAGRAERAARAEAERQQREEERQRKEDERREKELRQRIAHLTAAVERARKKEADLRERLDEATRERVAAEKDLERAR